MVEYFLSHFYCELNSMICNKRKSKKAQKKIRVINQFILRLKSLKYMFVN
ncbi:MAG: hypothetical protein SOV27_01805 [Eubacteriales bacterium]|nr:hypothetical protein [Eubacteriales bacterium]